MRRVFLCAPACTVQLCTQIGGHRRRLALSAAAGKASVRIMRRAIITAFAICAVTATLTGCAGSHVASARAHHTTQADGPAASATALPSAPPRVDNPAADTAAAAVLNTEDAKLAAGIAQGKQVIGTGAQIGWWNTFGDATRIQGEILDTFKAADAKFNAADEPQSITTWRDTPLPGDVLTWYQSDTGSGPSAATTQQVDSDIAALNAAAANVAKGQ